MFLVGLTGGISTGKSTVAKIFKDHEIPVVDADVIAREIVEPNKPAWKKIRDTFGEAVFNEDGELDREALGKLIFDDIEKRKLLNQITHPEIHKRMYKEIFRLLFAGHNFIVLDLPLLFETEVMLEFIHKVITVTCDEDVQLERLMARNNYSAEDATKRIKSQMPLAMKCEKSQFVIENSTSIEFTEKQTLDILRMLLDSNQHWRIRFYTIGTILSIAIAIYWVYSLFN